jgi:hypothetical protein
MMRLTRRVTDYFKLGFFQSSKTLLRLVPTAR